MQTEAVSTYIAPIIERYLMTLTTYNTVDARITRLLNKNGWGKDDSHDFKADIDYSNKLQKELIEAERDMQVASDLLSCVFGLDEARSRFPELWTLSLEEK